MSYRDQLLRVFSEEELALLTKLMEREDLTSVMMHEAGDRRLLRTIRDKLRGAQQIRNPQTTPPSKL